MASASSARYRFSSAEPVSGNTLSPAPGRMGQHAVEHAADAGVQDAGDVAGTGHAPAGHRLAQDLAAVKPGGFGFAQGPPQPGAGWVVQGLPGEVGGQRATEGLLELGVLGAAG